MGTTRALAAVLVLSATAVAAREEPQASSPTPQAAVETEETDAAPRPALRVLRHPYEISSFYRSGESPLGPWAGLPADPSYRIADFYRSRQGSGGGYWWSAFWTSGYRAPRAAPLLPYRRTIGENGDLFLAVPFLAPVGPISGAFFGY